MKLDKVTITGADESVKQEDLIQISKEYPFVEWGILISLKRTEHGSPRYPKWDWIDELRPLMDQGQFSMHLCGAAIRHLVSTGNWGDVTPDMFKGFKRAQLNFHGAKIDFHEGFTDALNGISGIQFILQMDGVNNPILYKALYDGCNVVPLFDASHGMGVSPWHWPQAVTGIYNGYAGGLGPDNLGNELEKIAKSAGEAMVWVDMETKVRSNDDKQFDLDKVVKCLEIAKPMISQ